MEKESSGKGKWKNNCKGKGYGYGPATAWTTKEKAKAHANGSQYNKQKETKEKARTKDNRKEKERIQCQVATFVVNLDIWQETAEQQPTTCLKLHKNRHNMEQVNGMTNKTDMIHTGKAMTQHAMPTIRTIHNTSKHYHPRHNSINRMHNRTVHRCYISFQQWYHQARARQQHSSMKLTATQMQKSWLKVEKQHMSAQHGLHKIHPFTHFNKDRAEFKNCNRSRDQHLWIQIGTDDQQQQLQDNCTLLHVWRETTHHVSNTTDRTRVWPTVQRHTNNVTQQRFPFHLVRRADLFYLPVKLVLWTAIQQSLSHARHQKGEADPMWNNSYGWSQHFCGLQQK